MSQAPQYLEGTVYRIKLDYPPTPKAESALSPTSRTYPPTHTGANYTPNKKKQRHLKGAAPFKKFFK